MDEQEDDHPQDDHPHGDPAMPMEDEEEEEEEPELVDITPAIQALRRMKSTISLLSRAIIRQEAGIARRRTIALMRATRRRAGRDDVPAAPSENEQQLAAIGPTFSEEEHDRELLSVMSQTLRMVRITSILQDFEEIQEKLLHEFEACMMDLQGGQGGGNR